MMQRQKIMKMAAADGTSLRRQSLYLPSVPSEYLLGCGAPRRTSQVHLTRFEREDW